MRKPTIFLKAIIMRGHNDTHRNRYVDIQQNSTSRWMKYCTSYFIYIYFIFLLHFWLMKLVRRPDTWQSNYYIYNIMFYYEALIHYYDGRSQKMLSFYFNVRHTYLIKKKCSLYEKNQLFSTKYDDQLIIYLY